RFGADSWMEPGHPEAAAYTVDVLMHLVRNYDIDGLHLDRIRYPDISVGGQTPSTGASVGYNVVNVARFQRRFGIPEG
ncbi:family 10 glycosylhydrolase, partial [Escherichia coli]|nr:family 10 glycosylhydrolase [Escherichia coli]